MKKNIYDKKLPPPATIIIYDLLIKMNVCMYLFSGSQEF